MTVVRLLLVAALTLGAATVGRAEPPADYALLDRVRRGALVLRQGSSGPAVAALQRALGAAGLPVTPTGYFGPTTRGLVLRFQSEQGCAVDGLVGRETMTAMDKLLGATPAPVVTLRRLTNAEVTPAITAEAVRILRAYRNQPFGFEVPFVADGKEYVGRIEQHYHPPGGAARPWGYHPGVSVLAVVR